MLYPKMASISPILQHQYRWQDQGISMAKMSPPPGVTNSCVSQIGWLTLIGNNRPCSQQHGYQSMVT
jgi:hypothetical protein